MKINYKFNNQVLDNGFKLAWQKTDSANIFANLRINCGSLHEKNGEEGVAHFLEHMLIEGGTEKFTPEEQRTIRDSFGYMGAFTSRIRTMIPCGMIASDFENYLNIVSQMTFEPRLDKLVLKQQKEIVSREIARSKGSSGYRDYQTFFWPKMARDKEHTNLVLGNEKDIERITEDKLRIFHQRNYLPNNMTLMLAGNISPGIIKLVKRYFGNYLSGNPDKIEYPSVPSLEKKDVKYSKTLSLINKDSPNQSNSELMIGVVVPDEWHEDSAALEVTEHLLGKSSTRGLKRRIRTDEGLSYTIGSSITGTERFGRLVINGKVLTKRQERAIDIVFEEFERLSNESVDEREIVVAKKRLEYKLTTGVNGRFWDFIRVDPINASSIAHIDYNQDKRPDIEDKIRKIKEVTAEKIMRVAQIYLPTNRKTGKYVMLVRDPLKK